MVMLAEKYYDAHLPEVHGWRFMMTYISEKLLAYKLGTTFGPQSFKLPSSGDQ